MRIELTRSYCKLTREPGDKRLRHESTVVSRMRQLLNQEGWKFTRFYPDQHGLTSSRLGLQDKAKGIVLWHERYQVEDAAEAFNAGGVSFQRVDEEVQA